MTPKNSEHELTTFATVRVRSKKDENGGVIIHMFLNSDKNWFDSQWLEISLTIDNNHLVSISCLGQNLTYQVFLNQNCGENCGSVLKTHKKKNIFLVSYSKNQIGIW